MVEIPATFREMPRWWVDGTGWLDDLPRLVGEQCARWRLDVDGPVRHGSNALVVPVRRAGEPWALRLAPPGDEVAEEADALRFWAGRGTVLLEEVDVERRAMLLERLDPDRTLARVALPEALVVIGGLIRRLAVPAPRSVRPTSGVVRDDLAGWLDAWERLGRPVPRVMLDAVAEAAAQLSVDPDDTAVAVNGDLHYEQVLAGRREPWLVVDPRLLRGDVGYDLGRVLWCRVDEMADAVEIRRCLAIVVDAAGLDPERSRRWVVYRAMSYLLWGTAHGLTVDPPRCRRLLDVFVGS